MDKVEVKRNPILIGEHTVALISLFTKRYDSFDEAWSWDLIDKHESINDAAKRLLQSIEDGTSVSFLLALRKEIEDLVRRWDVKFGSNHADKL